jgi:hypothetical protein
MNKLIILGVLLLAGWATLGRAAEDRFTSYSRTIEVPGMSKSQIFAKTNEWVVRYANFDSADKENGVILGHGEVAYPSPPVDRIEYTFTFKMRDNIQDNRETVTFDPIMIRSAKSYYNKAPYSGKEYSGGEESVITGKKDALVAKGLADYLTDNLEGYLKSGK